MYECSVHGADQVRAEPSRWLRAAGLTAAVAVVAAAIGVGTAWAGQTFSDVPPDHPFASEIEAVASAGITTGFNDGTFRPGQNVTRGAMAAFMGRGFGRLGTDTVGAIINEPVGGFRSLAPAITLTAGATGSGAGFVVVSAVVNVADAGEGSGQALVRVTDGEEFSEAGFTDFEFENVPGTGVEHTISVVGLFAIDADETATYTVQGDVVNPSNGNYAFDGEVTAVYVPFDGTGNAS